MRALLIGGNGFIGQYLARQLIAHNHQVMIVHSSDWSMDDVIATTEYYQIDYAKAYNRLADIAQNIDVVVILTRPDISKIKNIIAALTSSKVKKVVYLSTILLYPDSADSYSEDVAIDPKTEYEKLKDQEESLLKKFSDEHGCQLCVARLANVYGDVKNRGVIHHIISAALSGSPFTVYGSGEQRRDFIFIEDAVKLLTKLIEVADHDASGIFNICTGRGYSVIELIRRVENLTNKKIHYKMGKGSAEKNCVIGLSKKMSDIFCVAASCDIDEGLIKTYANYSIKQ